MDNYDGLSRLSTAVSTDSCTKSDLSFEAIDEAIKSWRGMMPKPTWIYFSHFAPRDDSLLLKTKDADCLLCHESMRVRLLQVAPHLARFEISRTKFVDFFSKWAEARKESR